MIVTPTRDRCIRTGRTVGVSGDNPAVADVVVPAADHQIMRTAARICTPSGFVVADDQVSQPVGRSIGRPTAVDNMQVGAADVNIIADATHMFCQILKGGQTALKGLDQSSQICQILRSRRARLGCGDAMRVIPVLKMIRLIKIEGVESVNGIRIDGIWNEAKLFSPGQGLPCPVFAPDLDLQVIDRREINLMSERGFRSQFHGEHSLGDPYLPGLAPDGDSPS